MSGIYTGLMMGVSQAYWREKLTQLKSFGDFKWTDVYHVISKSDLSRLKCSGFIIPIKPVKYNKSKVWRLNPAALKYTTPKDLNKKRIISF